MNDRDTMNPGPSPRHSKGRIARFKQWLRELDAFTIGVIAVLVLAAVIPLLVYLSLTRSEIPDFGSTVVQPIVQRLNPAEYGRDLRRMDGLFLKGSVKQWKDIRRPEGEGLIQFAAKQGTGTVASNRVFSINGTNYTTLFARTGSHLRTEGTLFVTADDVLIFLHPSGDYELLADGLLPQRPKVAR